MLNINCSLKSSHYFLWFIMLLHVLALVAILISTFSVLTQLMLVLLLLLSFYYSGYQVVLQKSKKAIVHIVYDQNLEEWILTFKNNQQDNYLLLNTSVVTGLIMVLNFRHVNKYQFRNVIVFSDSLDKESFRRLRIFLFTKKQV